MTAELDLMAPPELLEKLSATLPPHLVRSYRSGGPLSPYVRSEAVKILSDALAKGYLIDRTNSDGPLEEWDGWLVIHTPGANTFMETAWKVGQA